MDPIEKSDTLLAKWLSGEISQKELAAFEKTEDFHLFKRISEESQNFERPVLNKEDVYLKILEDIERKKASNKTTVRRLFPKKILAVAASLALLISFFYFNFQNVESSTGYGEQLEINLPDNSTVILNAQSTIVYNKKDWSTNRLLKLEGEAFFKVQKGSTFTVETNEGNITVLGTQFNVLEDTDFLKVECYEGKVKVESEGEVIFLTKGKTFTKLKSDIKTGDKKVTENPNWINGESSFTSVPLKIVLKSLENQYNIKFKGNTVKTNDKLFTGSFIHSDLSLALDAVFIPMNIDYIISNQSNIIELTEK
ncbi:FecR family protein [Tenacibaculum aiptasiae]|uniref:FecR family protein n=1 Tax=Tenacibaculum aiptasiae TaxID=426481 RepID=UPI00232E2BD5|nr:FecR family protein [Tenacibaculum aiptasiae]